MHKYKLRFRQVHLDFHTSPAIKGIGEKFNKTQWQEALRIGHVDSITLFSKCHHGWSYHPTSVGQMHPHLKFDLLRAQMDACREMNVNTPVYISAGLDDVAALAHPEWREIMLDGRYAGWAVAINRAGFHSMCFNTAYLDYLCDQIAEVARLFSEANGFFLDIISQSGCCCPACLAYMKKNGLDINRPEDRRASADAALERYYRQATAAARSANPDMPVFHNSGHVPKGRRDLLKYFSHLELESLPTGGWSYDHYPLSASYSQQLGLDFLGMTGKFHRNWGEFGSYKHPNALRYECASMLAHGSKCSVGDQLHPSAEMDMTTYNIIAPAYAEVERKEPWCEDVTPVSDIAVLSSESEHHQGGLGTNADEGAGRVLMEEHFLFDLIDREVNFSAYKLLILPDDILVDDALKTKTEKFIAAGGKLLLTGKSGLQKDAPGFALEFGATCHGESEYQPDYLVPGKELELSYVRHPLAMRMRSQKVKAVGARELARVYLPYFNRTWEHYCSHQYAPVSGPSEYSAALRKGDIIYLAHPVFSLYRAEGNVACRDYVARVIRLLLNNPALRTNLPSTARVTLMKQETKQRYVLHLLNANTITRGGKACLSPEGYVSDSTAIEVIEELLPLHDVQVDLELEEKIKKVTLEPQGVEMPLTRDGQRIKVRLDKFVCHQMLVFHYA